MPSWCRWFFSFLACWGQSQCIMFGNTLPTLYSIFLFVLKKGLTQSFKQCNLWLRVETLLMNKVCSSLSILLHSVVCKTICDPGSFKKQNKTETQLNDSVIYCCLKGSFELFCACVRLRNKEDVGCCCRCIRASQMFCKFNGCRLQTGMFCSPQSCFELCNTPMCVCVCVGWSVLFC